MELFLRAYCAESIGGCYTQQHRSAVYGAVALYAPEVMHGAELLYQMVSLHLQLFWHHCVCVAVVLYDATAPLCVCCSSAVRCDGARITCSVVQYGSGTVVWVACILFWGLCLSL